MNKVGGMKTIIASDRNRWLRFTSFVLGCTLCLLAKLAPADSAPKSVDFTVERFDVTGPNPLSAAKTDSILSTYAGPLRTLEDLRAAAADLEQAIRDKGFAFYRVLIPAQRIGEGVVELNVIAFQVEEIIVT